MNVPHREVPGDAQREIKIFLQALASYPERFACDPRLSFERHLVALAAESSRAEYSASR